MHVLSGEVLAFLAGAGADIFRSPLLPPPRAVFRALFLCVYSLFFLRALASFFLLSLPSTRFFSLSVSLLSTVPIRFYHLYFRCVGLSGFSLFVPHFWCAGRSRLFLHNVFLLFLLLRLVSLLFFSRRYSLVLRLSCVSYSIAKKGSLVLFFTFCLSRASLAFASLFLPSTRRRLYFAQVY